ncbi:MAG TPA: hypothetical protein VL240_12690 [Candidatus Binatia bacterium]|nr:hypothetical protein [Candidatus Binatia bacterium]
MAIGPQVNRAYESDTWYRQGSQLRMLCDLLGLTSCPGDGATSPVMAEFFAGTPQCTATQDQTVKICAPVANQRLTSPLQINAAAKDNEHPITGMVAYANSQVVAIGPDAILNATISLPHGTYNLVIRAWDSTGHYFSSQENFTVTSSDQLTASQENSQ